MFETAAFGRRTVAALCLVAALLVHGSARANEALILFTGSLAVDRSAGEVLRDLVPEGSRGYERIEWVSDVASPLAVGTAVGLLWRRDREAGVRALQALAYTALAAYAIKAATGRARPDSGERRWIGPTGDDAYHAFPSGHASMAFAAATVFSETFPDWREEAYALAAIVGLSRIALGRHWPSDVVAGALLGSAIARRVAGGRLIAWEW